MGDTCRTGCENSTLDLVYVECKLGPNCIVLDGVSRPVLVVNEQLPGPSIEVRLGCDVGQIQFV